ncbi:cyd operon protein YbgE [Vibrio mexicanus]|uniref:cyd operon protein YbgE n=1 Tax=Vibrio mexicanus TaxID=1004326 RepID=UPI00063CA020|nr:cyd operon protein YbgE [Vibrio mexicanus]
MSNLAQKIAKVHQPLDKALFRALSLILGFFHVAMLMWEPRVYSEAIGGFNSTISPLMIWAFCSSMVFGIGFTPRHWVWQLFFSPIFSLLILLYLTAAYLL